MRYFHARKTGFHTPCTRGNMEPDRTRQSIAVVFVRHMRGVGKNGNDVSSFSANRQKTPSESKKTKTRGKDPAAPHFWRLPLSVSYGWDRRPG